MAYFGMMGDTMATRSKDGLGRGLVVVWSLLALLWLGYVALLPGNLQVKELFWCAACLMGVALLFLAIWGATRPAPLPLVFWLVPQGGDGDDITGPYTVAQIVAMWKAGQITTHGLVAQEGTEDWMPVVTWAKEFDVSISPPREGLSAGAGCLIIFVVGLIALGLASGGKHDPASHETQTREAKAWVKANAKDPSSIVFNDVSIGENDTMTVVSIDWTGTNGFGGRNRSHWRFGFQKPSGSLFMVTDETTGKPIALFSP